MPQRESCSAQALTLTFVFAAAEHGFVCCASFSVPALQAMEGTRARYLLENITALRPFITPQVGFVTRSEPGAA